jgi:L-2-hydroxyglutarate oxidase
MEQADVVIVGGGVVGLATAEALVKARPGAVVMVLEKEERPAAHQSGRNSGVIHSGIYYRPGSLKARTVAAGRRALVRFCLDNGIAHRLVGKVIVAVDEGERGRLRELKRRADTNDIAADIVGPERLRELEPHAAGVEALHVPSAGIVDFREVCEALVRRLEVAGGEFRPRWEVLRLQERNGAVIVETDKGEIGARVAVNCAGLHSDHLLARSDRDSDGALHIVPFRGEYRRLRPERAHLVRTMIYPVPDPRFPFLGAHFTRTVDDEVHAGPNAVLALAREGYTWRVVDFGQTCDLIRFPGFRRLVARHWRTGLAEMKRSLWRAAAVRELQRLVPDVAAGDLVDAPAGVRAQAVDLDGSLVDDFVIRDSAHALHVLNAPSPAATAALEIGRLVSERALSRLQ